jgi:hypothetical protein
MTVTYTLIATWDQRCDDRAEVERTLLAFIQAIKRVDPRLDLTYGTAYSRAKALQRRLTTDKLIVGELKRIKPVHGQPVAQTKWLAFYWNGAENDSDDSAGLGVTLGGDPGEYPLISMNNVALNLPPGLGALATPAKAAELITVCIDCFQPDWVSFYTTPMPSCDEPDMANRPHGRGPLLGWRTYVSRRIEEEFIPKRARGLCAKPWKDGWLIEVGDHPLDPLNKPQDFRALDVIRKQLGWLLEGEWIPFEF